MNLTWSAKFIKHLLFGFNLIFVITGIVILGVGISVKAYYYEYEGFLDTKYFSLPNLLIATGVIIFLISFFGCYGAYKSNWFLIFVFSCFLVIIFIFELSAGIAGYVLRDKTAAYLHETMLNSQQNYATNLETSDIWDLVQQNFKCCGTVNYTDWEPVFKNQSLPISCCPGANGIVGAFYCNANGTSAMSSVLSSDGDSPEDNTEDTSPEPSSTDASSTENASTLDSSTDNPYNPSTTSPYQTGCEDAFGNFIRSHAVDLGAVGIILAVLQLVGIAFSCYLCRKLKHSYYST